MDTIAFGDYMVANNKGTLTARHENVAALDKEGDFLVIDGIALTPEGDHGIRMAGPHGGGGVVWPNGELRKLDKRAA